MDNPRSFVNWNEFLETAPPGTHGVIEKFAAMMQVGGGIRRLELGPIILHCDKCGGLRNFYLQQEHTTVANPGRYYNLFIGYTCKNCGQSAKHFAIMCGLIDDSSTAGRAIKVGEWPPFGEPLPPRISSLVGEDRENFFKGRRCEFQNFGIGAFAYYRRVVENQKDRLLSEIIKVAQRTNAPADTIRDLEIAKRETQFSKALDSVKNAIPDALKINGHNPLTLLHKALSEGIHANSDEQCLQAATAIRVVLVDLAERIAQALKDQSELYAAVNRLLNA
jgi:hypothetical protein